MPCDPLAGSPLPVGRAIRRNARTVSVIRAAKRNRIPSELLPSLARRGESRETLARLAWHFPQGIARKGCNMANVPCRQNWQLPDSRALGLLFDELNGLRYDINNARRPGQTPSILTPLELSPDETNLIRSESVVEFEKKRREQLPSGGARSKIFRRLSAYQGTRIMRQQ